MNRLNYLKRTLIFLVAVMLFLPTAGASTEFAEFQYPRYHQDENFLYEQTDSDSEIIVFDLRAYQCIAVNYTRDYFEGYGRNARAEALLECEAVSDGCRITKCGWL